MRSFCFSMMLVFVAACDDGPAGPVEIRAFCAQLSQIVSGPKECSRMALDIARLADDKENVRMKHLDDLLRAGKPAPEERRAYDGCKTAIEVVNKKCPGQVGPNNAVRAVRGDANPVSSVEAWVKKGNREDSGNAMLQKAMQ